MAGRPSDEDTVVTVVIESCVKELRWKFETVLEMTHREVTDEIVAFIERRRDSSTTGPIRMDIGMGRRRGRKRIRCTMYTNSSMGRGGRPRGSECGVGAHPEHWYWEEVGHPEVAQTQSSSALRRNRYHLFTQTQKNDDDNQPHVLRWAIGRCRG